MLPIGLQSQKQHQYLVKPDDIAAFHGRVVHRVCATFVLAREVEWTTRQFVFDLCEPAEEGIGTHVSIDHKSPAFVGEEITFTARIDALEGNLLTCSVEARVGDRLIATGKTGQRILPREKIAKLLAGSGGSPQ